MMKKILRVVTVSSLVLALVACGKKSAPESVSKVQEAQAVTPGQNAQPQQNQGSSAVVEPVTDLGALTHALRRYSVEKQRVPQSLDEIAAAGYVRIPAAPTGKKFSIDPKRLEVILVNR